LYHFLKSLFSVIKTSDVSVEGFESHVRNKKTMLQYKCSLLAIKPDVFNPIHHAGKLSQQYKISNDTVNFNFYMLL
jgi:hypothetical protein